MSKLKTNVDRHPEIFLQATHVPFWVSLSFVIIMYTRVQRMFPCFGWENVDNNLACLIKECALLNV